MYKVFVSDKLVILSDGAVKNLNFESAVQIEASSKKVIKEAYYKFINTPSDQILILYNKENEKRLLEEFISLFWYVEAAGGMVCNNQGEYLFIHRFGKWDLPKGKIEKNETKPAAAIREVQEETGLIEVSIINELPSTFHIFDYKGKKVLKRTYWYTMQYSGNAEPKPQTEEEITAALWFSPDKINEIYKNTYASLRALLDEVKQSGI